MPARGILFSIGLANLCATLALAAVSAVGAEKTPRPSQTSAEVLAQSGPADWRPVEPEDTLYLDLPSGRVVIELAPSYAPKHVANIRALVREKYFDGLSIVRVDDDYVTEWADPGGKREIKSAATSLPAEFERTGAPELPFTPLPDRDVYAPEVGLSDGFPVARDPKTRLTWLTHCYGMMGVGRGNDRTSGSGSALYVVIGHARGLDRNVALAGRVVQGVELLAGLPRGTGELGFYDKPELYIPIKTIRVAADLPPTERSELEVLRTDTATFKAYINARRDPPLGWYVHAAGHLDVCEVQTPVRRRSH